MEDFGYCLPYLLQLPHIVPDGRSSQIQFPNRWWYWSLRISPRQSDMADNVWQKRFWQPVECGRKKPSSFSIFYLSIYKRMSNRSVLGSLLSLSAPEDPPTFSSSNALAMMTSSGDGMTHQGHWPYHLLENCKSQLLKTKERSCLVRSIRKRQHHLRQIFSTTLSGDGVTYLSYALTNWHPIPNW